MMAKRMDILECFLKVVIARKDRLFSVSLPSAFGGNTFFFYVPGPIGFDSGLNGIISMSSAGTQLVNLMIHTF